MRGSSLFASVSQDQDHVGDRRQFHLRTQSSWNNSGVETNDSVFRRVNWSWTRNCSSFIGGKVYCRGLYSIQVKSVEQNTRAHTHTHTLQVICVQCSVAMCFPRPFFNNTALKLLSTIVVLYRARMHNSAMCLFPDDVCLPRTGQWHGSNWRSVHTSNYRCARLLH